MDTEQKPSTDLLDHHVRQLILEDIALDMYDAVHLGTPCSTFSELRQRPGGPRPLRSADQIRGLEDLRQGEKKALKEGNAHADFSADVMTACHRAGIPFTMENPEPRTDKDVSIFRMPRIAKLATEQGCKYTDFDQCMFDSPATKPTRILCWKVSLAHMEGKRCNHPLKTFRDQQGQEYEARHERVVGRKVKAPDGSEQWASKGLAERPRADRHGSGNQPRASADGARHPGRQGRHTTSAGGGNGVADERLAEGLGAHDRAPRANGTGEDASPSLGLCGVGRVQRRPGRRHTRAVAPAGRAPRV